MSLCLFICANFVCLRLEWSRELASFNALARRFLQPKLNKSMADVRAGITSDEDADEEAQEKKNTMRQVVDLMTAVSSKLSEQRRLETVSTASINTQEYNVDEYDRHEHPEHHIHANNINNNNNDNISHNGTDQTQRDSASFIPRSDTVSSQFANDLYSMFAQMQIMPSTSAPAQAISASEQPK